MLCKLVITKYAYLIDQNIKFFVTKNAFVCKWLVVRITVNKPVNP